MLTLWQYTSHGIVDQIFLHIYRRLGAKTHGILEYYEGQNIVITTTSSSLHILSGGNIVY